MLDRKLLPIEIVTIEEICGALEKADTHCLAECDAGDIVYMGVHIAATRACYLHGLISGFKACAEHYLGREPAISDEEIREIIKTVLASKPQPDPYWLEIWMRPDEQEP